LTIARVQAPHSFADRREDQAHQDDQRDQATEERLILGDPTPNVADVRHAAPTLVAVQWVVEDVLSTPVALFVTPTAATDTNVILFLSVQKLPIWPLISCE
jgi:hypothetical protein